MNDIEDDIKESLVLLLRRTNDDFGLTLSGNPISRDTVEYLQRVSFEIHAQRIQSQQHDPNNQGVPDQMIGYKRISF